MKCKECYSDNPRITPLIGAEDCLQNHLQYICSTSRKDLYMLYRFISTTITIILFICSSLSSINAKEMLKVTLSDELTIEEIVQNVFLVIHRFPWAGNSLLVKLEGNHLLWIDTPYTPDATAQVLDWLYDRFGNQIEVTEINTGFHIDNLGGNQELKKRKIPIYGSNVTCKLLKTQSKSTMAKLETWLSNPKNKKYRDVYHNFVFVEPTHTFDIKNKQIIPLGIEHVEVFFPGPTHTYDNLVVYIPSKKILFGGCMILSAEANKLGFIDDGNVKLWAQSIDKVKHQYKDIQMVIPGHGNAGGRDLLDHTIAVVNEFNTKH